MKHAPKRHQQSCELRAAGFARCGENDVGTSHDRQRALLFVLHDDSGAVMLRRYGCYMPKDHRYDF